MPSNTNGPLPKKSDSLSEKFKKSSGGLDDTEETVVTNINTVDKEGKPRKNLVAEANTSLISSNKNTDTVRKTDISQTSKEQSLPPKQNKPDTLNSIYKSGSNPRTNLSNKSTIIEKTT